jgi:hypothetical protein
MTKITTIKKLDSLINLGTPLFWYSHIFGFALEIEYINRSTLPFNYIECRFKDFNYNETIRLSDIYTK